LYFTVPSLPVPPADEDPCRSIRCCGTSASAGRRWLLRRRERQGHGDALWEALNLRVCAGPRPTSRFPAGRCRRRGPSWRARLGCGARSDG
jgi:hypothetical protein